MRVEVTKEGLLEVAYRAISLKKLQDSVEQIIDLIVSKNAEYGDAWQDFGIFTPLIRIREKLIRTESLNDKRQPVLSYSEDIDEELDDVIAYALLAKLWLGGQLEQDMAQVIKMLRGVYEEEPGEEEPDEWRQEEFSFLEQITTGHKHCTNIYEFAFDVEGNMTTEQILLLKEVLQGVVISMGYDIRFK